MARIEEIIIDLELSSICNLSCIHCPREKIRRKNTLLDWKTVDQLVNCIDSRNVVWFSGMGEPFLHPQIVEIVKKLKSTGAKVYTNTNASIPEFKERMSEAAKKGLDFVNVSVYGFDANTYKKTTKRDLFDTVKENIEFLKQLKMPLRLSYVIAPDSPADIKEKLESVYGTKNIRFLSLHQRSFAKDEQNIVGTCGVAKYYLFISCDGDVFPCVNDVAGENNLGNDILEASKTKKLHYPYDMCKHCNDPHRTIPFQEGYFAKVFDLSKRQK